MTFAKQNGDNNDSDDDENDNDDVLLLLLQVMMMTATMTTPQPKYEIHRHAKSPPVIKTRFIFKLCYPLSTTRKSSTFSFKSFVERGYVVCLFFSLFFDSCIIFLLTLSVFVCLTFFAVLLFLAIILDFLFFVKKKSYSLNFFSFEFDAIAGWADDRTKRCWR